MLHAAEVRATITGTGTIEYVGLEGGFYGIIGDDDRHYDPINLPGVLKVDGLRVRFVALERPDIASIHMWGEMIELTWIEPLGDLNLDMKVDAADIPFFVSSFGSQRNGVEWNPRADLNNDDSVDILDAILLGGLFRPRNL
jgi:hypothetical protein